MSYEIQRSKELGVGRLEKNTGDVIKDVRGDVEKVLVKDFGKSKFKREYYLDPGGTSKSDHRMSIWPDNKRRKSAVEQIAERFAGQLSTDPENVNTKVGKEKVNQRNFIKYGSYIVEGLNDNLAEAGLNSEIVNDPVHPYIIVDASEKGAQEKIVIDALLVKYLTGNETLPAYTAVFVGTHGEREEKIKQYGKKGAISILHEDKGRTMTTKVNPTSSDRFYDLVWDRGVKS